MIFLGVCIDDVVISERFGSPILGTKMAVLRVLSSSHHFFARGVYLHVSLVQQIEGILAHSLEAQAFLANAGNEYF